jgi:PAS domain S-box-containing protein
MPQKNGLEFLKELREKKNQIPFILFTGKGREEVAIKALNLGADGYFNKQGSPGTVYGELIHGLKAAVARRKAELGLIESQDRFQKAQAIAHVGNWQIDLRTKRIWGSEEAFRIYGLELTNDNSLPLDLVQKIVLPEDRPKMDLAIQELIENNNEYNVEFKIRRADTGEERFVHSKAELVCNQNGTPIKINGVIQDITDGKKAKIELEQRYEILERVTESLESGLAIIGKDYRVIWANSLLQTLGIDRNKKCYEIFNNRDSICPNCGVKKIFEENVSLDVHEYEVKGTKEPMWVELRVTPLKNKEGTVVAGLELAVPVTERKKAESALKQSEERYRLITENLKDVVTITDLNGIFTYVSPSAQSVYGYTPEEMVGKSAFELTHPEDFKELIYPGLSKISMDKGPLIEMRFRAKNGAYLWIENNAQAFKDEKGETKILSIARTIEKRKKTEERLAAVNEKLRVVGKLTRHDVRNKLAIINSQTYILKKKCGNDPQFAKSLACIETAVAMATRLFDFSSLYEKIGVEEQTNVDVENCLNEAVMLTPSLGNVKIINETKGLTVVADSLLRQVFYNLIDNSLKHGKKVTQIRLYYTKEGSQVKLHYEDNGVGVPPEDKPKIFNEGFTTGGGTGLALSVIKKIMEVYNWTIQEKGAPGEGAKFEITIPT